MAAARAGRVGQVVEIRIAGAVGESIADRTGERPQGRWRFRGDWENDLLGSSRIGAIRGEVPSQRSFLQDHVRVRSSEAKGADAGNRGPAVFRQWFEGNLNSKRQGIECDVGVRLREMQSRGDRPVVKCERRLDQPGDPGRRFEVTDIGLDRAHGTFRSGVTSLGKDGPERGQLDRIAELRPGTVTFDEIDLTRRDACRAYASRRTASCALRLGAVKPLVRPSWLIAPPRITA